MLEHVGRRVTLILAMIAISIALIVIPDRPFNLGLDLQGGTRLVYSLDFDEARAQGQLDPQESNVDVLNQTIDIMRNRVDPTGTRDATLRPEGTERIVIEIPGTLGLAAGEQVAATLAEPLADGDPAGLTLEGEDVAKFPETGGVVRIEGEEIFFARRDGKQLLGLTRAHYGTRSASHEPGQRVELISDDAIRQAIENLGNLEFAIVANDGDFIGTDTDAQQERQKLQAWVDANPSLHLVDFNKVPPEQDGPSRLIRWFPRKRPSAEDESTEISRAMIILRPKTEEEQFTGADLSRVFNSRDNLGYPAVGFEMKGLRKDDFGDFTKANKNRQMAIILNDQVESDPVIQNRLPGEGIIQGHYSEQQVRELITVLRSGSLRIKPNLEHVEKVGATLGADYVRRGYVSGIVAVAVVLLFMAMYYRVLGLFSGIALLLNFLFIMGGLAFLNATLTLPGIGGLILTIGMAVDANILIFDRIREEMDKGRNVKQASKTGFQKAMSAIVDSNLTTLLTAIILYKVGTGPVRGFAVTLSIGILSSMFAALVITRVLVHLALERGIKRFSMGTWMVTADYDFLGRTKLAAVASTILCLGGLTLFVVTPTKEKLGIDFTGGAEVHLVTASPQDIDVLRQRVAAIPALEGSGEVKPILESRVGEGLYTDFRASFKASGREAEGDEDRQRRFESELRSELADLLLASPVQIDLREEGAEASADLRLLFQETHPTADIADRLSEAGLRDPQVAVDPSRQNAFTATATTSTGQSQSQLITALERSFESAEDSAGRPMSLAQPIPASSIVGPQVVGELQDKAMLALAISLFLTVLYIRVRFAEYSYGIAAVAAVFHDVLIALGSLTLANHFGLVNGEISLPMIAAFLTIIGYSLNDTIIIFDRVRENLPRMQKPLSEVLNVSINQTLSRTILTSGTTFLAVLTMYLFNFGTGNVLESFSFAMIVGVLTGTYSTIFIANPIFLWLEERNRARSSGQLVARSSPPPEKRVEAAT